MKKVNNHPLKDENERMFHVLSQFVSNPNSHIYSIHGIPPEMIASLFAKYSRSDKPIKEVLYEELKSLGLTQNSNLNRIYVYNRLHEKLTHSDRAREFHEKYTLGFGHESVSKLADGIAIAVDRCSLLAASYMRGGTRHGFQCVESSTRYRKDFYTSYEVVSPELLFAPIKEDNPEKYEQLSKMYLAFTSAAIGFSKCVNDTLVEKLTEKYPYDEEDMKPHGITPEMLNKWISNRAHDNARFTLPVASLTSLGMVANSMAYNHLMAKLFNHRSPEFRSMAVNMHDAVATECPVLTKDLSYDPLKARANMFDDPDLCRLRKHILDIFDPEDSNKRLSAPTKADDLCYVTLEGKRVSGNDMVALLACVVIGQHTSLPPDMVYQWYSDVLRNGNPPDELLNFKSYPDNANHALSDTDWALKVLKKLIGQYTAGGKIVENRARKLKKVGLDPNDPTKTRFEVVGFEKLPRVFELADLTFDVVLDFGAWRDLQTHNMMTRVDYPLMPAFGFMFPDDIDLLTPQQRETYVTLFDMSVSLWKLIIDEPKLGQSIAEYAALNMWNTRKIIKINLRELDYIGILRTSWHGHFSYRRIVQMLYARTVEVWPVMSQILRVDPNNYALGRITKPVEKRVIQEQADGNLNKG